MVEPNQRSRGRLSTLKDGIFGDWLRSARSSILRNRYWGPDLVWVCGTIRTSPAWIAPRFLRRELRGLGVEVVPICTVRSSTL